MVIMSAGWIYSAGRRERMFDEYLKALSNEQLINLIGYQIERLSNPGVEQDALIRMDKIGEEQARRV